MKHRIIILLLMVSTMAFAQTPKTDFGKEFLPFWEAAKKQSMEMARLIPEDKYSFVPAEGGRSIEKMFLHIAYAHHFMRRSFIGGERIPYEPFENRTGLSKGEVMDLMETAFDNITTALINITHEELGQRVNAFGNDLTKEQMFYYFRDHGTSHVGKLKMAARMIGIRPPRYRFLDF
jgi:uncharacterized damage-inducible protein DinB